MTETKTTTASPTDELAEIITAAIAGETIKAVDSTELHRALDVKTKHADWIVRRVKQARLIQHEDFEVVLSSEKNPLGGRPEASYVLSLDSAKHLAMLEKTQLGHDVRRYFIEAEKRSQTDITSAIRAEVRAAVAEMMRAELRLVRTEIANTDLWTLAAYAKAKHVTLEPRQRRAIGSALATVCRVLGLRTGAEPSTHKIGSAPRTFPKSVLDGHFCRLVERHAIQHRLTLLATV